MRYEAVRISNKNNGWKVIDTSLKKSNVCVRLLSPKDYEYDIYKLACEVADLLNIMDEKGFHDFKKVECEPFSQDYPLCSKSYEKVDL